MRIARGSIVVGRLLQQRWPRRYQRHRGRLAQFDRAQRATAIGHSGLALRRFCVVVVRKPTGKMTQSEAALCAVLLCLLHPLYASNPVVTELELRRAVAHRRPVTVLQPLIIELGRTVPEDRFVPILRDVLSSMCALTGSSAVMDPAHAVRVARLASRFSGALGTALLNEGIRTSNLRLTRVGLQVTHPTPFHLCLAILRRLYLSPHSALDVSLEIARRQPSRLLSTSVSGQVPFLDAVRSGRAWIQVGALILVLHEFMPTFTTQQCQFIATHLRAFTQYEASANEMFDLDGSVDGTPATKRPIDDAGADQQPKRVRLRADGDEVASPEIATTC